MKPVKKNKPQGRPPTTAASDSRERILDSAVILFAGQGIAASSIAEIAASAGVTTAMIHYYFKSKDGLVASVAHERLEPCIKYVWQGITDEELASPRLLVTGIVDRFLEVIKRMPELPALWSREIINAGGILRKIVMELIPKETARKVAESLNLARRQNIINPGICSELLITSIMGILMLPLAARNILAHIYERDILEQDILREHALSLLLSGVCRA